MDVLFVFHDPGETYALTPVVSHLKEKGVKVGILATGASVTLVPPEEATWTLPFTAAVQSWMAENLNPKAPPITIVGVVSETQRVLAKHLKDQGSHVIGYYDSFHGLDIHGQAEAFAPHLSQFWCSLAKVGEQWQKRQPHIPVEIVGHPLIEQWQHPSPAEKLDAAKEWLDLKKGEKHVVYIAGYGPDFAEDFALFLEVAEKMPDTRFTVSLHPKMTGDYERNQLEERSLANVRIAPRDFSTRLLFDTADAAIGYRSSAGFMALFLGLPVFYLNHEGSTFRNFAIESGAAPQVSCADELVKMLGEKLCKTRDTSPQEDLFQQFGLPKDSARGMAERVLARLKL